MAIPLQDLGKIADVNTIFSGPFQTAHNMLMSMYAPQMTREQLNKAQLDNINQALINKYLPGKSEAEIYATRQQGGLYGAESAKARMAIEAMKPQIDRNMLIVEAMRGALHPDSIANQGVPSQSSQTGPLMNQLFQQPSMSSQVGSPLIDQSFDIQRPISQQQAQQNIPQQIQTMIPQQIQSSGEQQAPQVGQQSPIDRFTDVMRISKGERTTAGELDYQTELERRKAEVQKKAEVSAEQEKDLNKQMNVAQKQYALIGSSALSQNDRLKEMVAARKKLVMSGPILGRNVLSQFDTNAQLITKNAMSLMMDKIKELGQAKAGRILKTEFDALAKSIPDVKNNPEAFYKIVDQLQTLNNKVIKMSQMAQAMKQYTNDSSVIDSAFDRLQTLEPTVYNDSSQHSENLDNWDSYVNEDFINSVKVNKPYFTEDSVKNMTPEKYMHLSKRDREYLQSTHLK